MVNIKPQWILNAYKKMYEDQESPASVGLKNEAAMAGSVPTHLKDHPDLHKNNHMHPEDRKDKNKNQNNHNELGMHHIFRAEDAKENGDKKAEALHYKASSKHFEAENSCEKNDDKINLKLSSAAHKASAIAYGGAKFKHLHWTSRTGDAGNHPLVRHALYAHGHDTNNKAIDDLASERGKDW